MTNRTLLQFFHWHTPDGGKLWGEVVEKAKSLAGHGHHGRVVATQLQRRVRRHVRWL